MRKQPTWNYGVVRAVMEEMPSETWATRVAEYNRRTGESRSWPAMAALWSHYAARILGVATAVGRSIDLDVLRAVWTGPYRKLIDLARDYADRTGVRWSLGALCYTAKRHGIERTPKPPAAKKPRKSRAKKGFEEPNLWNTPDVKTVKVGRLSIPESGVETYRQLAAAKTPRVESREQELAERARIEGRDLSPVDRWRREWRRMVPRPVESITPRGRSSRPPRRPLGGGLRSGSARPSRGPDRP